MTETLSMSVGAFEVHTTTDGGHPPEFYAERICERLMYVSETAPPEIKLQAMAFKEAMKAVILTGVRGAILSNHTTVINQLRKAGMNEAAALVYELHRR